jgi:outer membrane translocation and assembly module TamA
VPVPQTTRIVIPDVAVAAGKSLRFGGHSVEAGSTTRGASKHGNGERVYRGPMTDETDATDEKTSTFLVTHADDASAMLSDVRDSQVHTLSENPGVEVGDVLEATVAPDPPMGVTYSVVDVDERKTIPVEASEESPTNQAAEMAADLAEGDLATTERAGEGEVHVLAVPESDVEDAVADVQADEQTVSRAARIGVNRVEIRSGEEFLSVRYLP